MKIVCSKCDLEKDLNSFRRDQHNPTGYHPHCNTCHSENQRRFYSGNIKHVRRYAREYYKRNAERISELRKIRRKKGDTTKAFAPKKSEDSYYKRSGFKRSCERRWKSRGIINFSYEMYEKMLYEQEYKCLVCSKTHTEHKKLCIDHDHKTGRVRGLLCNTCNSGIGKLHDDINILTRAIDYLKGLL